MSLNKKFYITISIRALIIAGIGLIFFRGIKSVEELSIEAIVEIPILEASASGDIGRVKKLIHDGAAINVVDKEGNSALMFAVWNGIYPANREVVEMLLHNQADTRCRNKAGQCVAQNVIKIDDKVFRMQMLGKLIKWGAVISDVDNKGFDVLQKNVETFDTTTTEMMIDWWGKFMPQTMIDRAKARAIGYNLRDVLAVVEVMDKKRLLNTNNPYWDPSRIDPRTGINDLHCAVINNDTALVDKIIKKKANINKKSEDEYGMAPLHYAVLHYHPDMLEHLLENGAHVHIANHALNTPLHMIAWLNSPTIAKKITDILMAKGANLAAQNKDGDTLMHMLVRNNNTSLINYLKNKYPVNLAVKNNNRETPIDIAKRLGRQGIIS